MLSASLLQLVTSLGLLFNNVNGLPALSYESLGQPIVDLGYSQYQGKTLSSGVNQYLGMRFAAPPVGDLRFRAPAEPLKITGLQNATAFQPICLGTSVKLPSSTQAEDCLFINVWGPASATVDSNLPVWVYIQGGGYVGNSNANYNGSTVVENSGKNIVFVNFNYRVGSWGFLASEKVRQDGDLNAGLLDERFALQWVQKYISKLHFSISPASWLGSKRAHTRLIIPEVSARSNLTQDIGAGNPEHVVIHGASAGAGSVALHLTAYGGRNDGLFVGAIGESVFFPTQPQVSELEWQFETYVNASGCSGTTDELKCLRSKDTTALQLANVPHPYPGHSSAPLFYWTPTIDGDFIQDYPYCLFERRKFVKVPIIFGDDTNEGSAFAANASSPAAVATFMQNNYPHLTTADTDEINQQYPLMPPLPKHAAYFPSASAAYGEATFTCPGNFIALTFAKALSPYKVWNYRYNVLQANNVASGLGVPHTFESPAIFGLGNANDNVLSSYATYNSEIIPVVMDYWISFVRELTPNRYKYSGAPHWESFGDGKNGGRRIVLQTNETAMEKIPADQVERCEFWRGLAITMEQ